MTEAVHLNVEAFRVPAHANVFIPVRRDDIFSVMREHEGGEQGRVAKDKIAS